MPATKAIPRISEKIHNKTPIIVITNGGNKTKYQSPRFQIMYITVKVSHISHVMIKAITNYSHPQPFFSVSKNFVKYSGSSVSTVIAALSLGCSKLI